ncbi:hypothetical protein QS306_03485 [Paraburkholderia bonniea]|uniref:hypothetical protein n=1 Tax=Paraburkholderia bonniea TaxID=2152891 RepID=UPI0012921CC2|nr:hypothetical protein [Paraburkholderia bonniea]WJF90740.1 hypothetical protein QS306_03485 [Paraburkholderia bonniea]WJF94054.1 hypothetical protein QS308_03485 [Paraburkholderia bonniea]
MSAVSASSAQGLTVQRFQCWPPGLLQLFDGTGLAAKAGLSVALVSTAESGELRTVLLGMGELYAPDARTLCVALWPQSRAATALRSTGRAALTWVFEGAFYQVQLRFAALPESETNAQPLAAFAGVIEAGESQRVGYARLKHGIGFELEASERGGVLERWELQIRQLRQQFAAAANVASSGDCNTNDGTT